MKKTNYTWKFYLTKEFTKPYMKKIGNFLETENLNKKNIYPEKKNIFKAFKLTPLKEVKVIIFGQDPYYIPNKATGLAFSVKKKEQLTETLKNIFKELKNNYPATINKTGCLNNWAKQGVLLLNNILTVEKNKPNSHKNIGWEIFTDKIIKILCKRKKNLIFVLMGKMAQKKENIINKKQYIIKTAHPSPLSAYNGFFNSNLFKKINFYLNKHKKKEIKWDT